jgi:Tfp pilus assembly protein PilF
LVVIFTNSLELKPDNAIVNGNYAFFLTNIRKDYDQAEKYYKEALELDPDHANNNRNYANFLEVIRKNYDQAEEYYTFLLGHNLCEYSLKRMRNCH